LAPRKGNERFPYGVGEKREINGHLMERGRERKGEESVLPVGESYRKKEGARVAR